jgi:predicted MFS family arabinose efflux permease
MSFAAPRIFRHRNYRLYFAGQMISLMGTWMQQVALGWLVYRLTNSPFLLGAVTFAAQAPLFFITPFAGAVADRYPRRTVFVITQGLCALQAALLTILTLGGGVTVWLLIVLSLFFGIVTAVETPVRQSFTIELVEREELRQAIALNAMMFNLARTIGPAIGGILVATIGEGLCFLLNTLSYGAVLASLLLMRLAPHPGRPASKPWEDFRTGFRYVAHHARLRDVLMLSTFGGFFGMSFLALLPAYAQDVLHEGSDALGFLMAAFGIGAFAGAWAASRIAERHVAVAPILGAAALGTALIVFANLGWLAAALAVMAPAGFAYLVLAVSNNSQSQMLADDAVRGRVMAFYAMGALGSQALGALLLGSLADHFGVPAALSLGGAACLGAAGLSYSNLRRRPQPVS